MKFQIEFNDWQKNERDLLELGAKYEQIDGWENLKYGPDYVYMIELDGFENLKKLESAIHKKYNCFCNLCIGFDPNKILIELY